MIACLHPAKTKQTQPDPIEAEPCSCYSPAVEPDDKWLSVDEIAAYLGISKDTVYTWVSSKGMPGHKVGRLWKFKREDVDTWVRDGGAAFSSDDAARGERDGG